MVEPRPAKPTVKFVDEYCQWYQPLFAEVRSFEAFKQLHLGLISEVKRKSLPAIAQVAGLDTRNRCIISHRIALANPCFRQHRLKLIEQALGEREIVLVIDDTGDRKKGQHTDYVKRQYKQARLRMALLPLLLMGSLIILRFLCCLRSTNPERLKPEDSYRSKPEIAAGMMRDLKAMGFRFSLVLADSLYGESGSGFVNVV